jgi:hypothetical protein
MSRSATNLLEMSSGDINSIHKRAVSSPIENVNNHSEEQPNRYTNPRRSSKVYQEIHVDKNANYRQKRNKRANEASRMPKTVSSIILIYANQNNQTDKKEQSTNTT